MLGSALAFSMSAHHENRKPCCGQNVACDAAQPFGFANKRAANAGFPLVHGIVNLTQCGT